MMIGAIIVLIVISICSYWLGYYGSKINTLNEFKMVMEQIHDKAMSSDFSDDYQPRPVGCMEDCIKNILTNVNLTNAVLVQIRERM